MVGKTILDNFNKAVYGTNGKNYYWSDDRDGFIESIRLKTNATKDDIRKAIASKDLPYLKDIILQTPIQKGSRSRIWKAKAGNEDVENAFNDFFKSTKTRPNVPSYSPQKEINLPTSAIEAAKEIVDRMEDHVGDPQRLQLKIAERLRQFDNYQAAYEYITSLIPGYKVNIGSNSVIDDALGDLKINAKKVIEEIEKYITFADNFKNAVKNGEYITKEALERDNKTIEGNIDKYNAIKYKLAGKNLERADRQRLSKLLDHYYKVIGKIDDYLKSSKYKEYYDKLPTRKEYIDQMEEDQRKRQEEIDYIVKSREDKIRELNEIQKAEEADRLIKRKEEEKILAEEREKKDTARRLVKEQKQKTELGNSDNIIDMIDTLIKASTGTDENIFNNTKSAIELIGKSLMDTNFVQLILSNIDYFLSEIGNRTSVIEDHKIRSKISGIVEMLKDKSQMFKNFIEIGTKVNKYEPGSVNLAITNDEKDFYLDYYNALKKYIDQITIDPNGFGKIILFMDKYKQDFDYLKADGYNAYEYAADHFKDFKYDREKFSNKIDDLPDSFIEKSEESEWYKELVKGQPRFNLNIKTFRENYENKRNNEWTEFFSKSFKESDKKDVDRVVDYFLDMLVDSGGVGTELDKYKKFIEPMTYLGGIPLEIQEATQKWIDKRASSYPAIKTAEAAKKAAKKAADPADDAAAKQAADDAAAKQAADDAAAKKAADDAAAKKAADDAAAKKAADDAAARKAAEAARKAADDAAAKKAADDAAAKKAADDAAAKKAADDAAAKQAADDAAAKKAADDAAAKKAADDAAAKKAADDAAAKQAADDAAAKQAEASKKKGNWGLDLTVEEEFNKILQHNGFNPVDVNVAFNTFKDTIKKSRQDKLVKDFNEKAIDKESVPREIYTALERTLRIFESVTIENRKKLNIDKYIVDTITAYLTTWGASPPAATGYKRSGAKISPKKSKAKSTKSEEVATKKPKSANSKSANSKSANSKSANSKSANSKSAKSKSLFI